MTVLHASNDGGIKVCLHEQCFSVLDATAASDTTQKIGLFLSLDAAVASDTEKHCLCKQTINFKYKLLSVVVATSGKASRPIRSHGHT
jgi:hypothetical protein